MKIRAEVKNKIYALLREGNSITEVCSLVGVARRTFYSWIQKYPKFKEEIESITIEIKEQQGTEAKRSMMKKVRGYYYKEEEKRYVYDKDGSKKLKEVIVHERYAPPSTKLIIRVLESCQPEVWSKRFRVDLSAKLEFVDFLKKQNTVEEPKNEN
jgi:transposase-like protein